MADDDRKPEKGGRSELTRYAVPLAIASALVSFAVANAQHVSVDFLLTTRSTRLIYVIVISVGLGIALGYLAARRGRKPD
jgi:uncharacterized integral membrane protein